jgi:hypothetical protein
MFGIFFHFRQRHLKRAGRPFNLNAVDDFKSGPSLERPQYVFGRDDDEDLLFLLKGHGYEVHFVEGDDPMRMHREFAATLDQCYATNRAIQADARANGLRKRPNGLRSFRDFS